MQGEITCKVFFKMNEGLWEIKKIGEDLLELSNYDKLSGNWYMLEQWLLIFLGFYR